MRSVKAERKSRTSDRPKPARRGQSVSRAPVERLVLGKKFRRDGMFSKIWSRVADSHVARRPIAHLTGGLIVATFLAAMFAGGYVSGSFKAAGRSADAVVAGLGFGISAISLSGNQHTPPSAIISALGFEPGESIFGADLQAARVRLLGLDWVADAQVRRQYPDAIAVSVVEKLPFALWQDDNALYVVERSGRVISAAQISAYPHLPMFVGKGAPVAGAELVDAIAQRRAIFARVKAMERVSQRRWNLLLDDGVVVELPEIGWAKQLDELEHLIVDNGVLERDIKEIDLRSPDNIFYQLRNSGKQQQPARGNAT